MPGATIGQISPDQAAQIQAAVAAQDAVSLQPGGSRFGVLRTPMQVTCRMWRDMKIFTRPPATPNFQGIINFPINPERTEIRIALRGDVEKTYAGSTFYYFPNQDRQTFLDDPIIRFRFNAGNLSSTFDSNGNPQPAQGRMAMWELNRLIDEHKIIPQKVNGQAVTKGAGEPNFVEIVYSSIKFPLITLQGWFAPTGIETEDDGQKPLEWWEAIDFYVLNMSPAFSDAAALKASFVDAAVV